MPIKPITDKQVEQKMKDFRLFFRTDEEGSVHIKDYRDEKYAVLNWVYKTLKQVEAEAYERGRSDCPCLNKYKRNL